jgi:membrane-associated phospholipid phosphatase
VGTCPHPLVAALLAFVALLAAGCRSDTSGNLFERHFSTPIWAGAFQEQLDHPEQSVPALDMLLATPVLMATDDEISDDAIHHYITEGTHNGDIMALALGGGVLATGLLDVVEGDGAGSLEIGAEALGATAAVTQILKVVVDRPRPEGNSHQSFPSGHASFSFASATFLARYVDDAAGNGWGDKIGYLAYIPAAYVGISRVEGQRHFASDVTFGAFLGIFLTNWIYNAHRAEPGSPRPTIEAPAPASRVAWRLRPEFDGKSVSMCLSFSL